MPVEHDKAMEVAAFRFSLIADFVNGSQMLHGQKQRLLNEISLKSHKIPASTKTRVSAATLRSWINRYNESGGRIESLIPKPRSDRGHYRKLDARIRLAIKELKQENPNYTVPVMVELLKKRQLIGSDEVLNKTTIYRYIKSEKLSEKRSVSDDRRAFEAPHPNELWQCDVLHGPATRMANGSFKKTYLFAIIDDHSRLVPHAEFCLSENFANLKLVLKRAVAQRGLPRRFYVDNGACYRSSNLEFILASLGIALSHSRPYKPEGRGKIERFFRHVRQNFFPIHLERPLPLQQMNERLELWLDQYHDSIHSATKMSPYERFRKNLSCLRPAPERLMDYFRHVETRKVRKDRSIQLLGKLYEVPVGLVDKTVELRFHPDDMDSIEVFHDSLSYGMAVRLDHHLNARIGRQGGNAPTRLTFDEALMTAKCDSGELF
jgi:putative transposase